MNTDHSLSIVPQHAGCFGCRGSSQGAGAALQSARGAPAPCQGQDRARVRSPPMSATWLYTSVNVAGATWK